MEKLDDDNFLLANILSYVGGHQYRFIAVISKRFRAAYDVAFPNDKFTHVNASTMEHAIICVNETKSTNWHPISYRIKSWKLASFCNSAVKHGNLEVLQYLRAVRTDFFPKGCPMDSTTCTMAAMCGHLHVLQYAHKHGCRLDDLTFSMAAQSGHLHIVQYLHQNGCPWEKYTCTNAAWNGHLQILKYAHERGCPWHEKMICNEAARRGHFQTAQYAHERGCPWTKHTHLKDA